MKQNQMEKRIYEKPQVQIIGIEQYNCLLNLSGNGGHNKANDDNSGLNAKQAWFDEERTIDN
ncbi:hypothetical protein [Prevotella nigrescens]|jgi:hypothetical protein|uniref:hypothetical protein n=2 Tax=Prevotella nigrescens TaxID=28133 RepID=UPI0002184587|nr:hypothetical protein [Prevotella nigrescens]EGQ17879.1 hypothetical protein HMPREF9419_0091 [Prevotella nigrescens ATCC 33563]UAK28946.1 hypothetical protein K8O81_02780 [Prevotella nigrescens]WMS21929.1 hypothetical protein RDV52_10750 [Prevotella nigrescens]SUB91888.1 Uncharacterised protein [Prevotella nigrescens]